MNAHRRLGFVWLILGILGLLVLNFTLAILAGPGNTPSVPAVLFLAYIMSQVGLVAAWAALADRVFWAVRIVVVLAAGMAIYWPFLAWSGGSDNKFLLVFAGHFTQVVIVLALMRVAGFRLSRINLLAVSSVQAIQFSLKNLLVFISLLAVWMAIARGTGSELPFSLSGILAAFTLAAVVAVLVPRRPLLWGLLACLPSVLVGVGYTWLLGKSAVPFVVLFSGASLMPLAVMAVVRRLGWRLGRCPPGPLSPDVAFSPEPVAIGSLPTT